MIEVTQLCFDYPEKRALHEVSFTIAQGAIAALVGPNGAGKTTLLRCLAALAEPFSGQARVAGFDTIKMPRAVHQKIGYLPDTFGLYSDLMVWQCLHFAALQHGFSALEAKEAVTKTAAQLGLAPYLTDQAGTLSRGWRQKVGIAQAMIHRPSILLLDEPASGLDPEARYSLANIFKGLREAGMTLIVSSHILAELEDYCTEMIILREGQVVTSQSARLQQDSDQQQKGLCVCQIQFIGEVAPYLPLLKEYEGVQKVVREENVVRVTIAVPPGEPSFLLKGLIERGAMISEFKIHTPSLQEIYLSSTALPSSSQEEP